MRPTANSNRTPNRKDRNRVSAAPASQRQLTVYAGLTRRPPTTCCRSKSHEYMLFDRPQGPRSDGESWATPICLFVSGSRAGRSRVEDLLRTGCRGYAARRRIRTVFLGLAASIWPRPRQTRKNRIDDFGTLPMAIPVRHPAAGGLRTDLQGRASWVRNTGGYGTFAHAGFVLHVNVP